MAILHSQTTTATHLRTLRYRTNRWLELCHDSLTHRTTLVKILSGNFRSFLGERRHHGAASSTLDFVLISRADRRVEKVHWRDHFLLEHAVSLSIILVAQLHATDSGHGCTKVGLLESVSAQ